MDGVFSPIELSDAYRTGIESVDSEHQFLVALYNGLFHQVAGGDSGDALTKASAELFSYADHHFGNEERLMQAAGYPEYETHKRQHDGFVRHLTELVGNRQSGGDDQAALLQPILIFVGHWIRGHILVTDKTFGDFLAAAA